MSKAKLYGAPLSLYTGRARSYLIKAGIAYEELTPTTEHYLKTLVPKAGGRRGMPTLETAGGEVIRDGAAIIDHYEAASGHGFAPATPRQRILSLLFDVIGAEGLLRPAMHYRWNFPDENLYLLKFHFEGMMPPGPNRAEVGKFAADQMRKAAVRFGVVPETFGVIEAVYDDVIAALNAHFSAHPYLLGGRPCIGDFGLIAPMYGHLSRDPKPLSLLQSKAIQLLRWTERMNRPDPDVGEFVQFDGSRPDDFLENDEVPDTMIALLKTLAEDFVPETLAAAETINGWLAEQTDLAAGTEVRRGVGVAKFDLRGTTINALAQPYRFYLLKRVQDAYAALDAAGKGGVDAMLAAGGMSDIMGAKLVRDIGRENNLEAWL